MAFKTLTAKYAGKCKRCTKAGLAGDFAAGTSIRWAKGAGSYHLSRSCPASQGQLATANEVGPAPRVGRCEDAPCCGHAACGFGSGSPGYGSYVAGRAYYGENEDAFEAAALGA